tara:strand:- start:3297 stop:3839 length:543 start_codon:yes stop_codon:yes gene_type:complete
MGVSAAVIIASLVIGGATAYASYEETKAANERGKKAAIHRNLALADQYALEEQNLAVQTERETTRLAYEKHKKREAIATAMAGSGRASGQGSGLLLGRAMSESYNLAAGRVGADANFNKKQAYMSMAQQQQSSWDQYLMSQKNPLLNAIATGMQTTASGMAMGSSLKDMKPKWFAPPKTG